MMLKKTADTQSVPVSNKVTNCFKINKKACK